ncbi:MAG: hypothetical protein NT135_02020 [Candidatus Berkelbacteria bacterium]|nr:hypothetical protein [Candidatus Berkelbacteria bacterium]
MKSKFILLWLVLSFLAVFCFCSKVNGQSNEINLIYPGNPSPLFSETNWSPGQTTTKSITVINNSSSEQNLGIQILNISNLGLAPFVILQVLSPSINFSSTLADLNYPKETSITMIPSGNTNLDLSISLSDNADNSYQNQSISFDIQFGFLASSYESPGEPTIQGPSNPLAGDLGVGLATIRRFVATAPTLPTPSVQPTTQPTISPTTPTEAEEKGVLGAEAQRGHSFLDYFTLYWWLWLILFLLLLLFFWKRRSKKKEE